MNRLLKHDIERAISGAVIAAVFTAFLVYIVGTGINSINSISEGKIVDKHIGLITDQKVFCPKTYHFTIEGEKRGKTVRYTFEVTENEYTTYRIGDWYER